MAWNDSFEARVDMLVGQFGQFLAQQTTLSMTDQVRAQEVCRDFCFFLGKNKALNQATPQDYAVYYQIHSSSDADEEYYTSVMALVQDFAKAQSLGETNPSAAMSIDGLLSDAFASVNKYDPSDDTGRASDERPRGRAGTRQPSMGSGLFMNPMLGANDEQASKIAARSRKSTMRKVDPQSIAELFGESGAELSSKPPKRHEITDFSKVPSSASNQKVSRTPEDEPYIESGLFQIGHLSATPARPAAAIESSPEINAGRINRQVGENTPAKPVDAVAWQNDAQKSSSQFGNSFDKFDFSIDRDSKQNVAAQRRDSMSQRESIADTTGIRSSGSVSRVEGGPVGTLRDASRIKYDFSESSKRSVLAADAEYNKSSTTEAIDRRLLNGFRSYTFKGKYTIDVQLPKAADYKRNPSLMSKRVTKLIPFIGALVLAAASFIFSLVAAAAFVVLALVALFLVFPDIKEPPHETPFAVLNALKRAHDGRCFCAATSLMAIPKSETMALEPVAFWKDSVPPLMTAMLSRFSSGKDINPITVCGGDSDNAILLLFEVGDSYTLVPMIRLKEGWFVTDASLALRKIQS